MILKINISTPKGQAKLTEIKLRKFILGMKTIPTIETNEDDSQIIWTVEVEPIKCLRIQRAVSRYDFMIKSIIGNRFFKKAAVKGVGLEGVAELEKMLLQNTKIEIIRDF